MPQDAFLVLPTEKVVALSPYHTITQTTVRLDPNDSHYISGGGDGIMVMLSKSQIEQLMAAANVTIVDSEEQHNDGSRVTYKVTGEVIQADGNKRRIIKSYELDLRYNERDGYDGPVMRVLLANRYAQVDKAKADSSKRRKWMPRDLKDEEAVAIAVRNDALREIEMMDRFKVQRAETGATLRMARSALSIRSSYKKTELATTPFVVYRATADLGKIMRMNPELATKMLSAALGNQLGLDVSSPGIAALLNSPKEDGVKEDNAPTISALTAEQVDSLAGEMMERGLDRSQADEWAVDIFGSALSGLTTDHIPVVEEYLELVDRIKERDLDGNVRKEVILHIRGLLNFSYAQGIPLRDMMEQDVYGILYPPEQEEEEDGETVDAEATPEEPQDEIELDDGDAELPAEEPEPESDDSNDSDEEEEQE